MAFQMNNATIPRIGEPSVVGSVEHRFFRLQSILAPFRPCKKCHQSPIGWRTLAIVVRERSSRSLPPVRTHRIVMRFSGLQAPLHLIFVWAVKCLQSRSCIIPVPRFGVAVVSFSRCGFWGLFLCLVLFLSLVWLLYFPRCLVPLFLPLAT